MGLSGYAYGNVISYTSEGDYCWSSMGYDSDEAYILYHSSSFESVSEPTYKSLAAVVRCVRDAQ
ncbi:MAG: hypothetical protein LBD91_00695 [Prevotellaceae bacterium]|nr:hypothetical protein [Prevotellaceae bacterium]